ncbi:phage protein NinX family protein [Microbulbifer sp. PSTR4-B]|uniref:phage protein NinX family protein n=1 Tax=unclassified Microbulbifer TaxID=2619833 RepID=UPI00403AAD83
MKMRSIEVAALSGNALDWAVGAAIEPGFVEKTREISTLEGTQLFLTSLGEPVCVIGRFTIAQRKRIEESVGKIWADFYSPSTNWKSGGELIEKFDVAVWGPLGERTEHTASVGANGDRYPGPSKLVAAMRAIVAHKLGEVVQVPAVLLGRI